MRLLIRLCLIIYWLAAPAGASAQDDAAEVIGQANAKVVQLLDRGAYAPALNLARVTLVDAENRLGPEHPETLQSVINLADLYQAQGRFGEAEPLYRRALEASERVRRGTLSSCCSIDIASLGFPSGGPRGRLEVLHFIIADSPRGPMRAHRFKFSHHLG